MKRDFDKESRFCFAQSAMKTYLCNPFKKALFFDWKIAEEARQGSRLFGNASKRNLKCM